MIADEKFPVCEPFAGGLEAHTHALCDGLQRRGHELVLACRSGSDSALRQIPLTLFDRDERGPEPSAGRLHATRQLAYQDAIDRLVRLDLDVLHINSLFYWPLIVAPRLSVPVVATLHTPVFSELAGAVAIERSSGAVRYLAVSEHTAQVWRQWVGDAQVIHNGVDLRKWRFYEHGRRQHAVWSGRLCPEKAPHLAIDAARAAGLSLDLCGYIYDRCYFDREVAPRLSSSVRYLGHVRQRELNALIGRAAVLLFSSVWDEPFGLVLIEALACGTPVAAFRGGAVAEIVDARCGRLAPSGDVAALARAAQAAAALNRRDCRRRVEQTFSHRTMVDGYETVFAQQVRRVRAA